MRMGSGRPLRDGQQTTIPRAVSTVEHGLTLRSCGAGGSDQPIRRHGPTTNGMNPPELRTVAPSEAPSDLSAPPAPPRPRRLGLVAPRLTAATVVAVVALNWSRLLSDPAFAALLVTFGVTATVAVLIHELGHYAVGSLLGLDDLVVRVGPLFGYCGAADGETDIFAALSPRGRIAFAAAGPTANLATYLVLHAFLGESSAGASLDDWVMIPLRALMVLSLFMGLVNLLPIGILDGGRIVQGVISMLPVGARRFTMRAFRAFTAAACATWLVNAVVSGRGLVWLAFDAVLIVALAVFGLAAELPEGDAADPDERVPVADSAWMAPILVAAVAAGIVAGQLVGLALYGS